MSRRSSVPNVSPLSRTCTLPPLTSINTSTTTLPPPPPYSAPPPIRSRSVPHLSQLSSSSSIHSRTPSSSTGSPEWTQSYLTNNNNEVGGGGGVVNSRRTVRPSRSRTSSSNSLGLAFNNPNPNPNPPTTIGIRSRLPSFEESFSGGGGVLLSAPITRTPFDTDEEEDGEEQGEALEIRRRSTVGVGELRRRVRQTSENGNGNQTSNQRRNGNGNGGGAIFSRTRSTDSVNLPLAFFIFTLLCRLTNFSFRRHQIKRLLRLHRDLEFGLHCSSS